MKVWIDQDLCASVPAAQDDAVIESAEECPGERTFIAA